MSNLAFIASVVGSLAIPVTVVTALLVFRRPLANLLGRIISYEGLGQKVNFGQKLAGAEESVSRVVSQTQYYVEQAKQVGRGASDDSATDQALRKITSTEQALQDIDLQEAGLIQLAEMATANPSFVVIKAWEGLYERLNKMVNTVAPSNGVRNPIYRLPDLVKGGHIGESFPGAVLEMFELRNNVAHGKHNPTPGEAVAYVESVRQLAAVASSVTGFFEGRRAAEQQLKRFRDEHEQWQRGGTDPKR